MPRDKKGSSAKEIKEKYKARERGPGRTPEKERTSEILKKYTGKETYSSKQSTQKGRGLEAESGGFLEQTRGLLDRQAQREKDSHSAKAEQQANKWGSVAGKAVKSRVEAVKEAREEYKEEKAKEAQSKESWGQWASRKMGMGNK